MRSLLAFVVIVALGAAACTRTLRTSANRPCPPPSAHVATRGLGIIGMSLERRGQAGTEPVLVVDRVVPDGPAATAGIHAGDRILEIEGTSTTGMSIAEAAHRLRGPIDASIALVIATDDGARDVTITRVAPSELWSSTTSSGGSKRAVPASDLAPAAKVSIPPCRP